MIPADAKIKAMTLPATYPIVKLGLNESTIKHIDCFIPCSTSAKSDICFRKTNLLQRIHQG